MNWAFRCLTLPHLTCPATGRTLPPDEPAFTGTPAEARAACFPIAVASTCREMWLLLNDYLERQNQPAVASSLCVDDGPHGGAESFATAGLAHLLFFDKTRNPAAIDLLRRRHGQKIDLHPALPELTYEELATGKQGRLVGTEVSEAARYLKRLGEVYGLEEVGGVRRVAADVLIEVPVTSYAHLAAVCEDVFRRGRSLRQLSFAYFPRPEWAVEVVQVPGHPDDQPLPSWDELQLRLRRY